MLEARQNRLLRDLLESAYAIRQYLDGVSHEQFLENLEKQDAVLRRFEIIGEAASRLSQSTKDLFPEIPFRSIRGMRNIIAHDYGEVDLEQVWRTASEDLELIVERIETHFAREF